MVSEAGVNESELPHNCALAIGVVCVALTLGVSFHFVKFGHLRLVVAAAV